MEKRDPVRRRPFLTALKAPARFRPAGGMERVQRRPRRRPALALGFFLLGLLSFPLISQAAPSADGCLGCHGSKDLDKVDEKGRKKSLFIDGKDHKGSVHKDLDCLTCHPQAQDLPHPKMKPADCFQCHPESIGGDLKKSVHGGPSAKVNLSCAHCHGKHGIQRAAEDHFFPCQNCHTQAAIQYKNSVHKKATLAGKLEAASCHDCHGGHGIRKVADKASAVYPMNQPRTCAKCHGGPKEAGKGPIAPHRDIFHLYLDTVHGRAIDKSGLLVSAVCTSCHGAHEIQSHHDPSSATHRQNIPQTCGKCHAGVKEVYEESVHGKWLRRGSSKTPTCTDCHSAHEIRRVDSYKWKLGVVQECGTCHEQSFKTFRDTFHGQVTVLGFAQSARCSDCHGYHDVLPSREPQSKTHPSNLLATCQKCHPKATEKFIQYFPHADPSKKEQYPILHLTYVFMTTILIGTFGFFGMHTVLWLPRSLRERLNRGKERQAAGSDPAPGPPGPPQGGSGSEKNNPEEGKP